MTRMNRLDRYYLAIAADSFNGELSAWMVNDNGPIDRTVKRLQEAGWLLGLGITQEGRNRLMKP